jgi:glycosyltransferase involved in cell wall biosynthesis
MDNHADSSPKVSVACIAYCHEAFIADAIEGVLKQKVDFPIEMVIGEDCSPDGTRDVILEYAKKHPDIVKLTDEYPHNLGPMENFRRTFARCRGEYIAYLDGDDYWTSPHKLRKQVELMDAHPEYSECFHAVEYKLEGGRMPSWPVYPPGRRSVYRLSDLAAWIRMTPSSMLLRRGCFPRLPDWADQVFFGDWMLQVLLAERGDIGYVDEVMGVKRLHSESMLFGSAAKNRLGNLENIASHLELFCRHLSDERAFPFARRRDEVRYRLVHCHLDQGDDAKARELFHEVLRSCGGYNPRVSWREPMLSYMHFKVPKLYGLLRRVWEVTWHRTAWHRGGAFSKVESAR